MWPETNHLMNREEDATWTLMSTYEIALIPLICHVVSMINSEALPGKTIKEFAYDLYEASHREFCQGDEYQNTVITELPGRFYPTLISEPNRYI